MKRAASGDTRKDPLQALLNSYTLVMLSQKQWQGGKEMLTMDQAYRIREGLLLERNHRLG